MDYLQKIMIDDHFQNLGYLCVLLLGGSGIIVILPLIIFSFITASASIDLANTRFPAFTHSYIKKGKELRV